MNFFFTPKMYQLNKKLLNCQMSPVTIFQLNTFEGTAKAPAVELLRLSTLRGTKTAFLTPKRYDEYPLLFIWDESKTFVRVVLVMHKLQDYFGRRLLFLLLHALEYLSMISFLPILELGVILTLDLEPGEGSCF